MIHLRGITLVFSGPTGVVCAIDDLTLRIRDGETLALVGTSGCGKSSTLKTINGLLCPTRGAVFFDGERLNASNVFAARLRMGYVIQGGALFPHLTVRENIAIMAKILGWPKCQTAEWVSRLFDLVGLDEKRFADQYPLALSGGEQQRVGVARSLMLDPPCLLMDEPFGALDVITRHQLQNDFARLKQKLKKTVVFVTHDLEEAFKLADRVAVMHRGKLLQCDSPEKIRNQPANDFVEEFLRL